MSGMKYIVFQTPTGSKYPILFPETMNHSDMAFIMRKSNDAIYEPKSAGAVTVNQDGSITAYGESFTLKIHSDAGDSDLIRRHIKED